MAKCIILVRISSKQQDDSAQKAELIEYAINKGYKEESQRILIENTESATKNDEEHRQGIADMKRYIEEDNTIDCVFCWEVSRLGRRYDVLESVRDFLIGHKVNLILLREGVRLLDKDGSVNSSGKLVVDVSMALAKYEMETKSARLERDRRKKTAEGKAPTGRVLFGYTFDKDGYVIADEEETAPIVREIFNHARDGKSALWIWDEYSRRGYFNNKSRVRGKNYILQILAQPAYCGRKGYKTNTKYKAIVPEELFDEVQNAKKDRINKPKTTSKFVAYGRSLVKYISEGGRECAMSIGHSRNSYRTTAGVLPSVISVNMNVIDYILWKETVMLYTQYLVKQGERTLRSLTSEREIVQQKMETAKKKINSIISQKERKGVRYEIGELTREKYQDEIKQCNKTIMKEEANIVDYKQRIERIDSQIAGLGTDRWAKVDYKSIETITDDEERKGIIDTIVKAITVTPYGLTEKGDKKYKIELKQKVNWLYNTFFEYWQRGGVFHLIKHSFNPVGEKIEYTKDISSEIIKRFPSDWSVRHTKK